jgi:predicted DNA-binding protein (MmcQ/YjbR family)
VNLQVKNALKLPGAILIENDVSLFRDRSFVSYEIGIQQIKKNHRFVNIFQSEERVAIYFKHDIETVTDFYRQFPDLIKPSEIAPRYWSKIFLDKAIDESLLKKILDDSYNLVFRKLSKKGKEIINVKFKDRKNNFLIFHETALDLIKNEHFYLNYSDYGPPALSYKSEIIARYIFDELQMKAPPEIFETLNLPIGELRKINGGSLTSMSSNEASLWPAALKTLAEQKKQ